MTESMIQRDDCFLTEMSPWSEYRESLFTGITSQQVAAAATRSGRSSVVVSDLDDLEEPPTKNHFDHWHKTNLSLFRNNWLIRHPRHHQYLAHPEFLSRGGNVIGKFVLTKDPWGKVEAIPDKLFREIQWELFVTGASLASLTWLEGEIGDDGLHHKDPLPNTGIVMPDLKTIEVLMKTADDLWKEVIGPRIRAGYRTNFASLVSQFHYVKPPFDMSERAWLTGSAPQGRMGPWKWQPWGMKMWDKDPTSGEILHLMVYLNVDENSQTTVEIGTFESESDIPEGMMRFNPVSRDLETVMSHTATSRADFFGKL